MLSQGRTQDLLELERMKRFTRNSAERILVEKSIHAIKMETGAIKSMRERLIKAHRESDTDEIKDIHEYIKNKSKYQNPI